MLDVAPMATPPGKRAEELRRGGCAPPPLGCEVL
eukprot:CAMPEP_0119377052 /NCGR_PEP_ID=MMETSP1334-20130426/42832_1 /TAXON_ID=127549 /ORGANISM="Calcidiscus leptoporus, Strain RCC1130" /LENGTH=33 /DNA_ID= /DNA_START= /DNA_END= /DNA_ORIENTATION=